MADDRAVRGHLVSVGLDYRTAPVALRELVAVPAYALREALTDARSGGGIAEIVLLSTCNRLELYAAASDMPTGLRALTECVTRRAPGREAAIAAALSTFSGEAVVRHLFRVVAGLESMVLGESEIAAQVKQAYHAALELGTTGPCLNRLFQKALHAAKLVRSRTPIGHGQASVGSVVVALARRHAARPLAECEVLLWGSGKAAEVTAKHLIKHGVSRLWIVNRTAQRGQELAGLCQAGWLSWQEAVPHVARVDIGIVCTQAPHYVLDEPELATVLPRRTRPLLLIDLAVPRNVAPTAGRRPGVFLYNIDDLQAIAHEGLAARQGVLAQCDALIDRQTERFGQRPRSVTKEVASWSRVAV